MPIFKSKSADKYVTIPNKTIQSRDLTWEARGLLTFMLSLPSEWVIHKSWLLEQVEECGRDKLNRILKELTNCGYLVRQQSRSDSGAFSSNDWFVFSEPQEINAPLLDGKSPVDGFPVDGEPATIKETVIQNKQETNKHLKDMSVSPKHDESVKEVFQHWQTVMSSPRSKLGDDRKKQIAKALKTYSVEELKKAITGCSMTPFNMGDNDQKTKYNGLDLILRNSEKIDKFISHADNPPATMKKQAIRQTGFNCAGLNNGGKTEL
jgi:hypothetical protein